ncbi:hypothetical protein ACQEWB_36880 [Streptomyces sp. CA-249302]|uniref:hypothetical protein n=1 Tax=Streptomyces sp. CA-249302 TaxID=3240058 RepID=UPI003D94F2D2
MVLVHGAFADSSSWNSEIGYLRQHCYQVYATRENFRAVPLPGGDTDVYLKADKFGTVYGNGLPKAAITTADHAVPTAAQKFGAERVGAHAISVR